MENLNAAAHHPSANTRPAKPRDQRLDFCRGLCLIDMLLVHLVYQNVQFGHFLTNFLGSYTRFAAGGFIFVSGLSIGAIFLPRAAVPQKRGKTYRGLWRRSVYILGIHYMAAMVSAIVLMTIEFSRSLPSSYLNPFELIRNIFLLRDGGDLLPFYVLMIALSPFFMEAVRRRWGWICLLTGSVGLFIWGLWHPWILAPAEHKFPPILWQTIFVAGLVFGWAWPRYNQMSVRWKIKMAGATWAVAGLLFVAEYSYQWGMPQLSCGLVFRKIPLSIPETVRYLNIIIAIIITSDLLWPRLEGRWAAKFVQTLGRKSLPVYVLHLWVVEVMGALAVTWPELGAWQILFAVVSLLVLWSFAYLLDYSPAQKRRRLDAAWSLPPALGREPVAD